MNRSAIVIPLAAVCLGGISLTHAHPGASGPYSQNFKIFGNSPLVSVRGVNAAGNPWVTDNSRIKLSGNGALDIKIRGLVLAAGVNQAGGTVPPALVGTNPVPTVRIAVTWMVPVPGSPVFIQETGPLPLNPQGDLAARVQLPGTPPANAERPIILVRAGATPFAGPFIASSDFVQDWGSSHPTEDDD